MVYLTPRFLCLAALVATLVIPSGMVQVDARAVDVAARHHAPKSSDSHAGSGLAKGKGKSSAKPLISLPLLTAKSTDSKRSKKHRKGGKKKNNKRSMHYDEDVQVPFGLKKRAVSRIHRTAKASDASGDTWDPLDPILQIGSIKIGDGRDGSYSKTHSLFGDSGILKRSPHHHDHDGHYDHDEIIVNGDNDKVHYHDRRAPHHHHNHHDHHGHEKTVVNGNNDDVHVHGRREPHHHHHHGHHDHEKTVVNGNNDDVHVHGRRAPHHHHHHDHHDHEKTVVNGNNDDVHVHGRREPNHHRHHHHDHHDEPKAVINGNSDTVDVHVRDTDSASGVQSGSSGDGHYVNYPDNASASQWKRSNPINQTSGVPGTVDIVVVGGPVAKKLASLVLSSVPQNSTANNSTSGLNGTKETLSEDSPFVLDASNTTQTQFLLVSKEVPGASSLEALKAVALKSTDEDSKLADIKVTLQVLVFEPAEVAMSQYCATYDPNPPVPAPLTMEECGKETERRSQTFAYNPRSSTIRPMWFSDANPAGANATQSIANSSSDSTVGVKQMNFKIPSSNKDVPVSPSVAAPVSPANVTGTVPSAPVNASAASTPGVPSAQNVTLVFTPITPAVHVVNEASDAASFQPADGSGPASSATNNASSTSMLSASGTTATSTDSSNTATATDGGVPGVSAVSAGKADARTTTTTSGGAPSNATDVMMSATPSGSGSASESTGITSSVSDSSAMPTSTSTVEQAAIERMYQQRPHMHVL